MFRALVFGKYSCTACTSHDFWGEEGWLGGWKGGTGWVRGGWRRWCPLLPLLPLPLCAAKLPTTSPQLCHFSFVNPPFSVSPNSPNSTHSSSPPPNPRPLFLTPPPPSLKPVNCWCDPFKPRRHSHCPHRVQERHLDWGEGCESVRGGGAKGGWPC